MTDRGRAVEEPQDSHDPVAFVAELASEQASTDRRLRVLLGAGASLAAGYPSLGRLGEMVLARIEGEFGEVARSLFRDRDLEQALTRVRRIRALLQQDESFGDMDAGKAKALEAAITSSIVHELVHIGTSANPYEGLAIWAMQRERRAPIEIFTLNYDLALEAALDAVGVLYFDGFAGVLRGRFRPDLVDGLGTRQLPAFVTRLWKLHGSINWAFEGSGDTHSVVRGPIAEDDSAAAIFPSEEKYEASRRTPFVVLHDRFRRALDEPESLLLVAGYSFGDQHLNETMFDAAQRNPRSSTIVFCHRSIPETLASRAVSMTNITVVSETECIWGGRRAAWATGDVAELMSSGKFALSVFPALAVHLGRTAAALA